MPTANNSGSPIGLLVAACAVVGATGLVTGSSIGVASSVGGTGVYTVTLSDFGQIDTNNACLCLTIKGATDLRGVALQTSDTTVVVRTFNAGGAAAAADFDLSIFRKSVG